MQPSRYLERHASAEARDPLPSFPPVEHVLTLPLRAEPYELRSRFATLEGASRWLCIAVLNASASGDEATSNAAWLDAARAEWSLTLLHGTAHPLWLGWRGKQGLLVVDRSSAGHRLAADEGVGVARKIGCDLALALWQRGQITSPWQHSSDADTTLPADYFEALAAAEETSVAAIYPFEHLLVGPLTESMALYELKLRYYVLGLAAAGSPYAYHSMGSTLAFRSEAYCKAHGMPRLRAGEDFYLLNKLAKLGPVVRLKHAPLLIDARLSRRVPFGTGPALLRLQDLRARGELMPLYHPAAFELLRLWLELLQEVAESGETGAYRRLSMHVAPEWRSALEGSLRDLGAEEALGSACQSTTKAEARAHRLQTWFDAFRSLKFVHLLRHHGLADLPWRSALSSASFLGPELVEAAETGASAESLCAALAALERHQSWPALGLGQTSRRRQRSPAAEG